MGWSIYVDEVVQYVGQCGEIGCDWRPPVRARRSAAEIDVETHRAEHVEAWRQQNIEWGDPDE